MRLLNSAIERIANVPARGRCRDPRKSDRTARRVAAERPGQRIGVDVVIDALQIRAAQRDLRIAENVQRRSGGIGVAGVRHGRLPVDANPVGQLSRRRQHATVLLYPTRFALLERTEERRSGVTGRRRRCDRAERDIAGGCVAVEPPA
ncbi:hypothetical protein CBM2638_U40003 [Cupriavidus taiwanensis]|uniref:Uncharacterized protein n=1 Tax=Cupriavidus taiwanensis TaxID=164546 RepID=A0A375FI98_9BURK|nr:hypothetical protein CBM2638_U40003 [Cupriavidus taiwanensis]SPD49018.1 protein of unknown function [Cupriavidus taiwanensis]